MTRIVTRAAFVAGSAGPLYTLTFAPAQGERSGAVLFFPPFAEEMNRSRRMVAMQARDLAARGLHVEICDLYGTGDSGGDFRDADWEMWAADMAGLWRRLAGDHGVVVAWSLRLGTLLAAEVADRCAPGDARHVMWQPVADGRTFMDQLLRLRLAAGLTSGGGRRESSEELRSVFAEGRSLEIAGYEITAALNAAIAARSLGPALPRAPASIHLFEVSGGPEARSTPAMERLLARLSGAGHRVSSEPIVGAPFWTTIETTVAGALIAPTGEAVLRLADRS